MSPSVLESGKFKAGVNGSIAIGPAAAIAKWGTAASGKVRLIFTYWGGLEKKLPKELQPTHGHKLTPHLVADSADHAKKITAAIKAWLLAKHPGLTQKKQKELTRFIVDDKKSYWVSAYPEEELDFVLEKLSGDDVAIPWQIAGDAKSPSIMWQSGSYDDIRVTITDDEVRFDADDQYAEHHPKTKQYGKLAFDGVLGAVSLDTTFAGLREPVAPATLKAPKKPTLLRGKKTDHGDGFVAKIEKGTYTVSTGADVAAKTRWLSLKRG